MVHEISDQLDATSGLAEVENTSWIRLMRLVYSWTDRRDASVDRAWWQSQRLRIYHPAVHETQTTESDELRELASHGASQHSPTELPV